MTQRVVNYTYGTGNPVLPDGSIDVRDGIDNLQSMDVFMNAPEDTYNQRDGEIVRTVSGMNKEFDAQILNMGFTRIGTFASGATLTNPRQTLLWDVADGGDGQEYGWSGSFPPSGKVVPPGGTPLTTGGIAVGAWMSRFDPELRIQVREALRRSYAEAGYTLIDGSFEQGGTLVNTNDVLLHETSGKAYSGPAGNVDAGTNPASGGFVDRSAELLRTRVYEVVSITDFKADTDSDWTAAFNAAAVYSKDTGKRIHVPSGTYHISDSIKLVEDPDVPASDYYGATGSRFYGEGRKTKIIKTLPASSGANAVFAANGTNRRGFEVSGMSIIDRSANSSGIKCENTVSCAMFRDLAIYSTGVGIHLNSEGGNTFVSVAIEDVVCRPPEGLQMTGAIKIPSGTSYRLDRVSAFEITGNAFDLGGAYTTIGVLACDDCTGIPYVFRGFRGSIQSLGAENINRPSSGTIVFIENTSSVSITNFYTYNINQPANTSFVNIRGNSLLDVGDWYISDGSTLSGRFAQLLNSGDSICVNNITNYKYVQFAQDIQYPSDTTCFVTVGGRAGSQTIPYSGESLYQSMLLPLASQSTVEYRIMGRTGGGSSAPDQNSCVGTLTAVRGDGSNSIRVLVADVNTISSTTGTSATLVKKAVSSAGGLADYTGWFQGSYGGVSYLFIKLEAVGPYNMGTYFSGLVHGKDPNLFKVISPSDITNLQTFPGVIKTEQAS